MTYPTREDILRELELLPVWRPRESMQRRAVVEPAGGSALPQVFAPMTEANQATLSDELSAEMPLPLIEAADALLDADRLARIREMDWSALQACVKDCQACKLAEIRAATVFGMGDPNAEWLFVGDAPADIPGQLQQGEPFTGQGGQLLDNMLIALQLRRGQNVYMANVLKCHTTERHTTERHTIDNRYPPGDAARQCEPFLQRQIALVKPKVIVAMGEFAAQSLLQTDAPIDSLRGQVHRYEDVPLVVTFHPQDLLSKPENKPQAWADLCLARQSLQTPSA